nr:hypothetical protein [Tanacetum cinerariifolium]GEX86093.1 hypothetical protein [Tanacetum cinerariifolium]
MSPEQAYQSQLAYPLYGFQNFANPRNTPPQYFPPQPSQPQHFSQQQSQTQFKVPQGKDLRDERRKQKRAGKQPVVDLDEDDDDDTPGRRNLARWNQNEEMLLDETWIEHSHDVNIGKDQQDNDYRRKCDAAERAYEAKGDKELAMMQRRELEFLMLDPSTLPPEKRAITEKKQSEIMKKYPSA